MLIFVTHFFHSLNFWSSLFYFILYSERDDSSKLRSVFEDEAKSLYLYFMLQLFLHLASVSDIFMHNLNSTQCIHFVSMFGELIKKKFWKDKRYFIIFIGKRHCYEIL